MRRLPPSDVTPPPSVDSRGFTVIELLIVIIVISLLTTMALPAFRSITEAHSLSSGSAMLADQLNLARQTAITRNLPVEFRIYRFGDGTDQQFRGISSVIPNNSDTLPPREWVQTPKLLPAGILLDQQNNFEYSTVLKPGTGSEAPVSRTELTDSSIPPLIRGRPYIAFTFRPDGSTNLNPEPPVPWTITIRSQRSQPVSGRPAYNFVTLLLDPVLGRARAFQP